MNTLQTRTNSIFDRSGLAALSDLKSSELQEVFTKLETEQDVFLAKQSEFLCEDYRWPRDPLHEWSRRWEYPYVYHHLKKHAESLGLGHNSIVDLGSAVTFFPFSVAKLAYHVHCLDIDASQGPCIERATKVISHSPGKVDFKLVSDGKLPFEDGEVDAVYCISVLEHIPDFENTIEEVFRILKPNGLFILTIDLDLCGYGDIGISAYNRLRSALSRRFDISEPEFTVHPLDVLTFRRDPFPFKSYPALRHWKFRIFHPIRRALGKTSMSSNIAVWGVVLAKRNIRQESAIR